MSEAYRSSPEYYAFYAKNKSLNPRLPPPLHDAQYYAFQARAAGGMPAGPSPWSTPSVADLILGGGSTGSASKAPSDVASHASDSTVDPAGATPDLAAVAAVPALGSSSSVWAPPEVPHEPQWGARPSHTQGWGGPGVAQAAPSHEHPHMPPQPAGVTWGADGGVFRHQPPQLPTPPQQGAGWGWPPHQPGFHAAAAAAGGPGAGGLGPGMVMPIGMPPAFPVYDAEPPPPSFQQHTQHLGPYMQPYTFHSMSPPPSHPGHARGGHKPHHAHGGHSATSGHPHVPQHSQQHTLTPLTRLHQAAAAPSGRGRRGGRKASNMDGVFASCPVDLVSCPDQVPVLCRDQVGSRYVQWRYNHGTATEQDTIAEALTSCFEVMARDPFGNYAVQVIMQGRRAAHKHAMLQRVVQDGEGLCQHSFGCRVVQRALEEADASTWSALSALLHEHLLKFVSHENGNHVLQKLIQQAGSRGLVLEDMVKALLPDIVDTACHAFGCRVAQRLVECAPHDLLTPAVFPTLLRSAQRLMLDDYGNFVLQHMLLHGSESTRAKVCAALKGHYVKLSSHKCASNVMERLLERCCAVDVSAVVWELLGERKVPTGPHSPRIDKKDGFLVLAPAAAAACPVRRLLVDRYGNYVLQKALGVAPMAARVALALCIFTNSDVLASLSFGGAIVGKAMSTLQGAGVSPTGRPAATAAAAASTSSPPT